MSILLISDAGWGFSYLKAGAKINMQNVAVELPQGKTQY